MGFRHKDHKFELYDKVFIISFDKETRGRR